MKRFIKRSAHWIGLILSTDLIFIFATWIIRREAIKSMSLFIFLYTLLAFAAGLFAEFFRQKKEAAALQNFLDAPMDSQTKEHFLMQFDNSTAAKTLCTQYLSKLSQLNEKTVELSEYRNYIEAWVHEAKTPLSLFTLVFNNHKDEMSPYVYTRFHYIGHQLNEDVERILYYARLQADHPDIKFARFRLDDCVASAALEFQAFMEEKGISFSMDLRQAEIVSDQKVVSFILSQLFSNAVKYADSKEGKVLVSMRCEECKIHLGFYNNGESVPPEDLPFLFDKGFTGSYPNRQKATGMGLYLARKYAEQLCVTILLDQQIPYEEGFGIILVFAL